MTNTISLMLALAMTFGVTSAYAVEIEQEVQIGVYGADGPNSKGGPAAQQLEEYGEASRGLILEKYQLEADFENYDLEIVAEDVNKNNRRFKMEGGNRGKTTWELHYDEMPHLYTNGARTFYENSGSGVMKISSAVHTALDNSIGTSGKINARTARDVTGALPYTSVGVLLKSMGGELKLHPQPDLVVEFDAMRTSKRGTGRRPPRSVSATRSNSRPRSISRSCKAASACSSTRSVISWRWTITSRTFRIISRR